MTLVGDDPFMMRIPEVQKMLSELKASIPEVEFWHYLQYLQYNVPVGELRTMMRSGVDVREWKEMDPLTGKMGGLQTDIELFERYVNGFHKAKRNGYSFLFYGPNSSGKTYLALWMLSAVIEAGNSGWFMHFKEYMNLFNDATYGKDVDNQKLLEHIYNCSLLVLDEVGKESKTSENVVGEFEHLLKHRDSHNLPTILITNLKMEQFENKYRNSVRSLLDTKYRFIQFSRDGEFRKGKRVQWEI
jgi:DNA replication protein DnaC